MKKMKCMDINNGQHFTLNQKFKRVFVNIGFCLIVFGIGYWFYEFSTDFQNNVGDDHHDLLSLELADLTISDQFLVNNTGMYQGSMDCDVFTGEWVRDETGPRYTNHSCNTIEHHQNCMKNGRPDSDYINWRWSPFDCYLPTFNPKMFLHFMRKKSMAFIGDSISRNHVQSLLCILSQVEEPVEVYHDDSFKSFRWLFKSYDFTLSVIWSPFLTKANIFEDDNGHSSGAVELHLDELDPVWVDEFNNFNYIMIAGGKWFMKTAIYYENNTIIGCHNCNKENVTEISFYDAYRKAIRTTLDFITRSNNKVYTFLRTTTPDHFENGEWNTGGYCNRTGPFKDGEVDMRDIDTIMRDIELEEFANANDVVNGSSLKLFDTTHLSLLRPDGHPGPYRDFHPFDGGEAKVQNDCLHWCLPGPIDSWNDIMMNILLRA